MPSAGATITFSPSGTTRGGSRKKVINQISNINGAKPSKHHGFGKSTHTTIRATSGQPKRLRSFQPQGAIGSLLSIDCPERTAWCDFNEGRGNYRTIGGLARPSTRSILQGPIGPVRRYGAPVLCCVAILREWDRKSTRRLRLRRPVRRGWRRLRAHRATAVHTPRGSHRGIRDNN